MADTLAISGQKSVSIGLLAVASVATMDVIAKVLGETYSASQLAFFRFAFGLLPLLLILPFQERSFRNQTKRPVAQFIRGGLMFGGAFFFFIGLKYLTLAEATAILFAEPIIVIAMAAVVLKEPISLGTLLASMIGLTGVLVMLRPGSGVLRVEALLPLCAATFSAIWLVLTRSLGKSEAATTSTIFATLSAAGLSLLFLPFSWMLPSIKDLLLLAGLGLAGCLSTYLYSKACIRLAASAMAVVDYTVLVWAIWFGFLFWGEIPDTMALAGCFLIIVSGLLVLGHQKKESS